MSAGDYSDTNGNPPRREDITGSNLPRSMTTAQILREVDRLREIQEERLASLRQTIQAQLDGMSTALELTQSYPTMLDKTLVALTAQHEAKVDSLYDLYNEKFASIGRQLSDRDERFRQMISSVETAFAKSEGAVTKITEQIIQTIKTSTSATDDKVDDLRARVGAIESKATGRNDVWGIIVGGAGLMVALIGIVAYLSNRGQPEAAPVVAPVPVIIQVPAPEVIVEPAPLGTLR